MILELSEKNKNFLVSLCSIFKPKKTFYKKGKELIIRSSIFLISVISRFYFLKYNQTIGKKSVISRFYFLKYNQTCWNLRLNGHRVLWCGHYVVLGFNLN